MKIAVWVPLGMDVPSTLTFGRSDARVLILGAFYAGFCMKFYVRFEEMEASSQCFILPVNPSNHLIKKETPRQTSALQGACRRRLLFCFELWSCERAQKSYSYSFSEFL